MRLFRVLLAAYLAVAPPALAGDAGTIDGPWRQEGPAPAAVDESLAARLLQTTGRLHIVREEQPVPGWSVTSTDGPLGFIASTWEIVRSLGYSGRPIDVLVAVSRDGGITGAELVRHNEPVLTLGISTADIARYVGRLADAGLGGPSTPATDGRLDPPDVIAGATVSTAVIRDAILRTARTVAAARTVGSGAAMDRVHFAPMSWSALYADGALARVTVTLDAAREALAGAVVPIPAGDAAFIDLWVAILDPPTIGRNLLGEHGYARAMASLGPGQVALLVASRGLHSHRGTAWRQGGMFDRLRVIQGVESLAFRDNDYLRIDRLAISGAPEFKEISLFRLPMDGFEATRPFTVEVTASRATPAGEVSMRIPLAYALPSRFVQAASPRPAEPLWVGAWQRKRVETVGVGLMLAVLALILFLQEGFVRRPGLWRWGRIGFLMVTLVWLGWIARGQLSVVHVVAFLQSLVSGFRWETFLIEPIVFMLWSFVALGLLFWGRGVYCGWLCPFGALQELTNQVARHFAVPQIEVPLVVQERLWVIKYTLFVAILGLSFYSMEQALVLAEVEPFKTAMSMRFQRAWPFLAFVVAILAAGLFIERFYCRYICPLGAALAIPAKLRLFDWLKRRPQCGRECRLCEKLCTVGAIDAIGRINPNECVLCLRCQMIYHSPDICTVLKRRQARPAADGSVSGAHGFPPT